MYLRCKYLTHSFLQVWRPNMTCKHSLTPDLCKNRSCHTPECKLKLGSKLVGHKWLLKVWSFPQKLPVEWFAEGMEIRPAHVSSWGARGKRKGCVPGVLEALVFCERMEENKRMSTTELLFFRAKISMANLLKPKLVSLRCWQSFNRQLKHQGTKLACSWSRITQEWIH